jgi:bifunctional DNase/RNase
MEQSGTGLIELKLVSLSHSNDHQQFAVVLAPTTDPAAERMVVVIGTPEARQLAMALEVANGKMTVAVKFMEDLLIEAYGRFNYTLEKICINSVTDAGVFAAVMYFKNGDTVLEVTCRTSDAVTMAIKCGKPIYVATEVFQKAKINMDA